MNTFRSVNLYLLNVIGGPTYTFLEPQPLNNIIEDLTKLYARLVDLGVVCRNGQVYLADLT